MKNFLLQIILSVLCIFTLPFCSFNSSDGKQKKLPKGDYYGKVKFVKRSHFTDSRVNGGYDGDFKILKSIEILQFDENGNLTEVQQCDKDGNLTEKTLYILNSKGQELQEVIYQNGNIYKPNSFTYDAKGNMIERIDSPGNKKETKYIYRYDASGNEIEALVYNYPDTITPYSIAKRFNNKEGRDTLYITKEKKRNWNTEYTEFDTIKTKYDKSGNAIEKLCMYNYDGFKKRFTFYKHDSASNIIEESDNEERTKWITVITEKRKYDLNGNMIEKLSYGYNGKLTRTLKFEFTYDEQNNWISKKTFCDEDQTGYEERVIEYYK